MTDQCCKGCQNRKHPWTDEEGNLRHCRQGCEKWEAHEAERRATYNERKRRIQGDIGISPEREKNRHKLVMQYKYGNRRGNR